MPTQQTIKKMKKKKCTKRNGNIISTVVYDFVRCFVVVVVFLLFSHGLKIIFIFGVFLVRARGKKEMQMKAMEQH